MPKPPEEILKEPTKIVPMTQKHRRDQAEKVLGRLAGTAIKVASWAVASVIKELLPEGFDPNLRAAAYLPAYHAAYLSAYMALSKNEVDLDTARFESQASARGAVSAVIDPILHPENAPIKLF
jgi:hypothetical protein